ncbi:hypothetical protein [Spirosoma fluminis]
MKQFVTLLIVLISLRVVAQPKANPTGQRYFGMHFDFHAEPNDTLVGKNLSERSLDSLLTAIKPDFIQVDSKGHPGVASYPSKVANATTTKRIVNDPLAFYRTLTKKHGIDMYVHYSGVFDDAILAKHPGWSAINANGDPDKSKASVHGPYVDSLLIPQLNEVADYGINGVWVDGECWATVLDYSPAALARFKAQTGIQTIPRSAKDAHYQEFKDFSRQSFLRYLGHYVDELHRHNPKFRVASNWAYSSMMPEPITTHVDYLSGDLTPGNSINSAALEGRILAPQGQLYQKPWDLMTWSFWQQFTPPMGGDQKTAVHLMQDAAEIISLGGGFQVYFRQHRDASLPTAEVETMKSLSRFVRVRQPYCQGSTPVPQLALLYSNATFRKYNNPLFSNEQTQRIQGLLTALLDSQLPVDVLAEHHIQGRMSQYPVIIVSQQDSLAPAFREELLTYARQGGNLVLIGAETTRNFANELNVTPIGSPSTSTKWVSYPGPYVVVNGAFQPVQAGTAAHTLGRVFSRESGGQELGPIATTTPFGKGKLIGVYADLSRDYQLHQSPKQRDFISWLTKPLLKNPKVEISGTHLVHVVVNQLGSRLAVNLINTGGKHTNPQVFSYDELPPLANLTVRIRLDKKPQRIVQQPENKQLAVTYANGIATVRVPSLAIHSILVVN